MIRRKVSVCVITYQQEQYIGDTLESILKQQGDFELEIVIGEDCGKDKTRQICEEYQTEYPDIIKVLPRDTNLGMNTNFWDVIQNCTGEYIAFCEGDDYWLSTNKLQKQVEFLHANLDYVMCFHDAQIVKGTQLVRRLFSQGRPLEGVEEKDITVQDILSAPIRNIHLAALCVRANHLQNIQWGDWFFSAPAGDLPITSVLATQGKNRYFNDVHCIYRRHEGGITNRVFDEEYYQRLKFMFEQINETLGGGYNKEIQEGLKGRLVMFHGERMKEAKSERKFWTYFKHWWKTVQLKKYTNHSWRDLFWILRQYLKK